MNAVPQAASDVAEFCRNAAGQFNEGAEEENSSDKPPKSRPYTGEPNSTYWPGEWDYGSTADGRRYGSDGKPVVDYDHSHGNHIGPDGNELGDHVHNWDTIIRWWSEGALGLVGTAKFLSKEIFMWVEVKTTEQVSDLLSVFCGFHDSILKCAKLSGKVFLNKERHLVFPADMLDQDLFLKFDSQIAQHSIELCFAGLKELRLLGRSDEYDGIITEAFISFEKDSVRWADTKDLRGGIYVESKGLSWRAIL